MDSNYINGLEMLLTLAKKIFRHLKYAIYICIPSVSEKKVHET